MRLELLISEVSTVPFFHSPKISFCTSKTNFGSNFVHHHNQTEGCWSMSSWVGIFDGQCAGENRKEESKGWKRNGSTHDLALLDITASAWDVLKPRFHQVFLSICVELIILILWQHQFKYQANYAYLNDPPQKKSWEKNKNTVSFWRNPPLVTRHHPQAERDHQATTTHIGWSIQRCRLVRLRAWDNGEWS